MTKDKKIKILTIVTILFAICIALIPIKHARIALAVILAAHYYIFLVRIPTKVKNYAIGNEE